MIDNKGRKGGKAIWGKAARWVDNSGKKKGVGSVRLFLQATVTSVYSTGIPEIMVSSRRTLLGLLTRLPIEFLKRAKSYHLIMV